MAPIPWAPRAHLRAPYFSDLTFSVSAVLAFFTHLSQILMTFENLAAWGPCLCAVCPSPTTIVTSGASTVVCVWDLSLVKGRPRGLQLRKVCASHSCRSPVATVPQHTQTYC